MFANKLAKSSTKAANKIIQSTICTKSEPKQHGYYYFEKKINLR